MMLMPWGPSAVPTGGAGVAAPAWIWIFTTAATRRFAIVPSLLSELELGDVAELELYRRLATEDVHEHLELRAVNVDLADHTVEVGEGAGDDPHLLAHLVLEARADLLLRRRALFLHAGAEDVLHLAARERGRLRAASNESCDAGRVAHDVPRVVVEVHAHQQVTGEDLLLDDDLAPVLELDDVLHRDDDLEDAVLDRHRTDAARQVRLHLVLVSGIRVHDIPTARTVVGARLGPPQHRQWLPRRLRPRGAPRPPDRTRPPRRRPLRSALR